MAIAISLVILGAYALWAFTRKRTGAPDQPGAASRKKKRKACKWGKTGETKGRFVEYRCERCSVVALSHTGQPPQDCKSDLGGTRPN